VKFLSLVLENYGSYYGRHELALSGLGLVLVLGKNLDEPRMNSNGSGKSTPWEAFDWCLWGVIPRGDHVDSIINEEAGKNCLVGVRFEDDLGRLVQVERFRKWKDAPDGKETGLRLTVGGENQTCLDVDETQAKLEAILGLDREVFHAAILFGQNDNWRFADGTDSERIDILTRVLQLGEIDGWLEKAKGLQARVESEQTQYDQALLQRRAELVTLGGWISRNRSMSGRPGDETTWRPWTRGSRSCGRVPKTCELGLEMRTACGSGFGCWRRRPP